jgi:hypothetical protein
MKTSVSPQRSTTGRARVQDRNHKSPVNGVAVSPALWQPRPKAVSTKTTAIPVAGIAYHAWDGDGEQARTVWYMAVVLRDLADDILALLAQHAPGAESSVNLAEALLLATRAVNQHQNQGALPDRFHLELPGLLAYEALSSSDLAFACGRALCENFALLRDHLLPELAPLRAFRLAEALAIAFCAYGEFTDGAATEEEVSALCNQLYWQVLTGQEGGAR